MRKIKKIFTSLLASDSEKAEALRFEKSKSILWDYFNNNEGYRIHKWKHFFDIYEAHFSRFRGMEIVIVEFGVFHGGSLQMWKHYFGEKARVCFGN